jgi:hypothetical protein
MRTHVLLSCRMGVEMALLDCVAAANGEAQLLPSTAQRQVAVNGLVSEATVEAAVSQATQLIQAGCTCIKVCGCTGYSIKGMIRCSGKWIVSGIRPVRPLGSAGDRYKFWHRAPVLLPELATWGVPAAASGLHALLARDGAPAVGACYARALLAS